MSGVDPLLPLRITRIAYAVTVRERGNVVAQYGDLHSAPQHIRAAIARVLARPAIRRAGSAAARSAPASEPDAGAPMISPGRRCRVRREPIVVDVARRGADSRPLAGPCRADSRSPAAATALLTLRGDDFIGEPAAPGDSDFARDVKTRGIERFALIDEIALIAVPDILIQPDPDPEYLPVRRRRRNPCLPARRRRRRAACTSRARPASCRRSFSDADDRARAGGADRALRARRRPLGDARVAVSHRARRRCARASDIVGWRARFDARCAALYAPWLDVAEPRGTAPTRPIPPAATSIGAIARTDLSIGVQRAPANSTSPAGRTSRAIDDALHGELNEANVNACAPSSGAPHRSAARAR